jgi:hypothetical protein
MYLFKSSPKNILSQINPSFLYNISGTHYGFFNMTEVDFFLINASVDVRLDQVIKNNSGKSHTTFLFWMIISNVKNDQSDSFLFQ